MEQATSRFSCGYRCRNCVRRWRRSGSSPSLRRGTIISRRACFLNRNSMTLPVAMDVLRGYLGSGNLALVMAAMSMSVLPVVLLFLLAQKMVIEGVAMSGIKN